MEKVYDRNIYLFEESYQCNTFSNVLKKPKQFILTMQF
jgi:hypothetical protein